MAEHEKKPLVPAQGTTKPAGPQLIVYNHFAYHLYQLSGTVKVDNWWWTNFKN